jgi:mono/diheme cytochrome c family protein
MREMSELIRTCRIAAALAGTLLLTACGTRDPLLASYPERIDFNQHIRPILSDNCFRCHGPDPGSREAGLRLDLAESALAELPETKGKHAIVPGDPDSSELVRRVTSQDEDVRMPPPETHRVLTDVQVALLKEWIDEGAEYKPHWAFIAPQKPEVPDADFDGRAVNEIDRFVSARLQQEEMQPAQEADKAALMARVSLTLTGLPPSLAEVDARRPRIRAPTRRSSRVCLLRRTMPSTWPPSGSIWRAGPRAMASSMTITTACCGRGAIG